MTVRNEVNAAASFTLFILQNAGFSECLNELFVDFAPVFFARERCDFEGADSLVLHVVSELYLLLIRGHKLPRNVPHGEREKPGSAKAGKCFEQFGVHYSAVNAAATCADSCAEIAAAID